MPLRFNKARNNQDPLNATFIEKTSEEHAALGIYDAGDTVQILISIKGACLQSIESTVSVSVDKKDFVTFCQGVK